MVGSKRNRAEEGTGEKLTKSKDPKDKFTASLRSKKEGKAKIQDTETKIAPDLNGVDSNEDSDDSDSSVYSELEEEEEEEEENDSSQDDEDTNQSGDNETEDENKENESSRQKKPTENKE